LTLWSEERNQQLLARAYAAVPEGGSVVIYTSCRRTRSGPLSFAIGSTYSLAIATGESLLVAQLLGRVVHTLLLRFTSMGKPGAEDRS
jgi:hypothetical protein